MDSIKFHVKDGFEWISKAKQLNPELKSDDFRWKAVAEEMEFAELT